MQSRPAVTDRSSKGAVLHLVPLFLLLCSACDSNTFTGPLAGCEVTCGDGPTFVVSQFRFVTADADGVAAGLNLDGVVSSVDDEDGCKVTDLTAPDGTPGIDNQMSALLAALPDARLEIEQAFRDAVATGDLILLVEVVTTDAADSSASLGVLLRRGAASPKVGAEGLIEPDQAFAVSGQPIAGYFEGVQAAGSRFSGGPTELDIRTRVQGSELQLILHQARFESLVANPDDQSFSALLAGALSQAHIIELVDAIFQGESQFSGGVGKILPLLLDMEDDNGDCDRLSVGIDVTVIPADIVP